jgi:hypothetical protein
MGYNTGMDCKTDQRDCNNYNNDIQIASQNFQKARLGIQRVVHDALAVLEVVYNTRKKR